MQQGAKVLTICVVSLFILMTTLPTISAMDDQELDASQKDVVKFTDMKVTVLTSDNEHSNLDLSAVTSNVQLITKLPEKETTDILIVDSDWIKSQDAQEVQAVDALICSGVPVIAINSQLQISDMEVFNTGEGIFGIMEGAQVFAKAVDSQGYVHCYSADYQDIDEAIESAYVWAEKIMTMNAESSVTKANASSQWTYCGSVTNSKDTSQGDITAKSDFYSLQKDGYTYYYSSNELTADPDSYKSKKGMDYYNNINQESLAAQGQKILRYGPTQINGSTVNVNFGNDFTDNGNTIPVSGIGWNYLFSGSLTDDSSISSYKYIMDLKHNINECYSEGTATSMVRTGLLMSCDNSMPGGSTYSCHETYTVEFCNVVIPGNWHNTFTEYDLNTWVYVYPSSLRIVETT